MPSVSKKQHNLMAAVANNPAFAKKAGIPQRVGADFLKADKGRKFAKGGDMTKKMPPFMGKETKAEEAKEMNVKAKSLALYKQGERSEDIHGKSGMKKPTKYASGGFTSCADGKAKQGRTKAQQFAMGGMPMAAPAPSVVPSNKKTPITPFNKGFAPTAPNSQVMPIKPKMGATPAPSAYAGPVPKPSVLPVRPPTYGRPGSRSENFDGVTGQIRPESSTPRPTNPFTNPKQYAMEQQMQQAFSAKPKPPMATKTAMFNATREKQQQQEREANAKGRSLGTPAESSRKSPGIARDMMYRGNDGDPAKQKQFRQQQTLEKQRAMDMLAKPPMATKTSSRQDALKLQQQQLEKQRGGLSNISPKAKSNIGDALAKMMSGVRAKGAKEMASRGGTGFNAPNMMDDNAYNAKKGGSVKKFASGGSIDGCAVKGKTKGKGRIF